MGNFLKSILFIFITIFSLFNFLKVSANNETYFIITAYYSPLPNQKHYTTWSYYWDKRLNWEGHTTASGKKPFAWVLAAPKKYPFWTKIYFEWIWVWVVEDRWWAIVKAWTRGHQYDRIDIWMWYGDEGLYRARKWWTKTVKWKIVSINNRVTIKFANDVLAWLENIKVNPENHKKEDVELLQKKFKELWLYNWKIDWKYESIKNALINFQLKNWIIKSKNSIDAWWFGPKTYLVLLKKYSSKEPLLKNFQNSFIETNPKIQKILEAPEIRLNWDNPQKEEVIKVQKLFKSIWLYSGKIDWNYNSIKDKILEIQKQAWIIKKDNDWWAWYFWEKTKAALIKYCEEKFTRQKKPKKKITIDDISYSTLKKVWEKLKKLKSKDKIIKKLEKSQKLLKKESRKAKIKYLIKVLKW